MSFEKFLISSRQPYASNIEDISIEPKLNHQFSYAC